MKTIKNKLLTVKYFSILLFLVFFAGQQSQLLAGGGTSKVKIPLYEQNKLKTLVDVAGWERERARGATVLSAEELAECKISVVNGKIRLNGVDFTSSNMHSTIYVMDQYGDIYIKDVRGFDGVFFHASFFNGAPVAAAGDIYIVDGVLKTINNCSGHYQPTGAHLDFFRARLVDMEVDEARAGIRTEVGDCIQINFGN